MEHQEAQERRQRELQRRKDRLIMERQVELTYANGLYAIIFSVVNVLLLGLLFFVQLDFHRLIGWLVAMFVVLSLRMSLLLAYRRKKDTRRPGQWAGLFTLSTAIMGTMWGVTIPLFAPSLPPSLQSILMLIIGGIIAAASAFQAAIYVSYAAFAVPAILPMIVFLVQSRIPLNLTVAALVAVFVGLMLVVARRMNQTITRAAALEFRNISLLEELKSSEERFRTLTERSASAYFIFQNDRFIYINPTCEKMIGYTVKELQQRSFLDIVHPEHREMIRNRASDRLAGLLEYSTPERYECMLVHRDGHTIWVNYSPGVMELNGEPAILGTVFDISEQKRAEERMSVSEKKFRMLFNMANDPMFLVELADELNMQSGIFRDVNAAACEFLGYSREELLGMRPDDISAEDNPNLFRAIYAKLSIDGKIVFETEHRAKDGRILPVEVSSHMAQSEGTTFIHSTCRDISLRKQLMEKLTELANTDPLTGSLNRRSFWNRGAGELDRSKRYGHPLMVLMIDIDHFKDINDTHGHSTGDLVLRSLVTNCLAELRTTDIFGRVGGEEFAAMLVETDLPEAIAVAERIRVKLENMTVNHGPISVGCTISIGVAEARAEEKTLDDLIGRADKALYHAKETGRNKVVSFGDMS